MNKILVIIAVLLLGCSKINQEQYSVKNVTVYKSFEEGGYTTASAWGNYKRLDSAHVEEIALSQADVDSIQVLIRNSRRKKHFQTKYGIKVMFCRAQVNGSSVKMLILSEKLIVDLTNMRSFHIYDQDQQRWLKEFILKVKS